MQLKYHLGDGSANVVGGVRTTDVECPFVGAIFICFRSEIKGYGAVGYWETGGGVGEPAGRVGLRHGAGVKDQDFGRWIRIRQFYR